VGGEGRDGIAMAMDNRTGDLIPFEQFEKLSPNERGFFTPATDASETQIARMKVGRNESCPCGSGKKFKKCHLQK
jgi:uncharacterized protein YecA (UPF0149 family)